MSKSISVLGSTGSIGRQTLQVAEELGLPFPTVETGVIVKREAQGDFAPPHTNIM